MCLLDPTAAFDISDHGLLMLRLERQFGLRSIVFNGSVHICQTEHFRWCMEVVRRPWSLLFALCCKVLFWVRVCLFYLYTVYLADVPAAHDVNIHSYADDTQLYPQCQRRGMRTATQWLEICLSDVSHWMAANRLKLNVHKTEVTELLWASSKFRSASLAGSRPPLRVRDKTITASTDERLPGVTISSDLSTHKHVSNIFHPASTGFIRFEEFVIWLTLSLQSIGTCLCFIPCQWMHCHAGWLDRGHLWTSSVCAKCCSSGHQWNSQVRLQLDTPASLLARLAGCSSAYPV